MTQLKTLKDLEKNETYNYGLLPDEEGYAIDPDRKEISFTELREEAIKWYKGVERHLTLDELEGARALFRHFFNLTDEDLKWLVQ